VSDLISRLLDLAAAIQQIPAPTFHESARAEFVRTCFSQQGLEEVEIDAVGNAYGRLAGRQGPAQAAPLVVSAHLDTVFPASTRLNLQREQDRMIGPGIGDNSLGVAALLGLAWSIQEQARSLAGDLWLVANVCEEGLGDLRGMRAVVDRFGDQAGAYIILEGMGLGQIYHRGLSVQRYRITVHTPGGHSWVDYGRPSAVHELASLSARITALPLPEVPRTSLNIGVISGGTTINTIASEAMLELDLRSESHQVLDSLADQVERLCRSVERPGVETVTEVIGRRPGGEIASSHPLVRRAEDCLRSVGIEPHLNIASTDANLPLSRALPAVTVGLTKGGGGHSLLEYVMLEPVAKGLKQVVELVNRAWE
jgi:acetylornithine deacetylase/succinyl-diaminopimelate desuccinylase-like protein